LILVWLPRALKDRDEQLDYIAQDNPQAAIEQGDRLEQHIDLLVEHPEIGPAGRRKSTREMVISRTPFVVVYRLRPKLVRIEIVRVLHSAQQWPKSKDT